MKHDDEFVKKKIRKSHGANIKGKIQNQPIIFTVDTGASRTVLSTNFFYKIKSRKPNRKVGRQTKPWPTKLNERQT